MLFVEVLDATLRRFGHGKEDLYRFLAERRYLPFRIDRRGNLVAIEEPIEAGVVVFRRRPAGGTPLPGR